MSNKKQMPAFSVLTIICLVAALALAGTNAITKGPIKEHAMAAQREAFGAVMTADEYNEMPIPEGSGISALVEARQDGKTIGYCVAASSGGYAGPVAVTLGVGTDGKVTGAKIGDTSFAETSGFGSRWLAENQTEQFVGIDLKEGGTIEALSGATLTSNAVLNASNTALSAVSDILGIERTEPVLVFGVAEKKPVEQMTLTGDIHEGSAKGFASDVKVQLTLDASGAITGLAIDSSGETSGFGSRCMEDPTFAEQFIGKTAPFTLGENIDALAGASVTSGAVVNAVNAAVEAPANPDAVPFGSGAEEEPAVEVSAEPVPEGAKTASAKGLMSDVKVTITLNEDGTIATMAVDCSGETAAIAGPCAEEAFLSQFIGKKGPFENVDMVSGATFTSTAVMNAVNSLFAAEEPAPAGESMTGKAQGFQSEVTVTLTVDAGVITAIKVDSSNETPGVGTRCGEDEAFLAQFVGKKATPDLGEGIEVLSGASVTSNAVIEAANAAIGVEVAEVEIPAVEEAPAAEELTASAKGLMSDVKVTITLNEDGTIATMAVDCSGETAAIAGPCAEEAFLSQFIGKKGPFESIDMVSGATFTSTAVMNAVNSLFAAEEPAPAGESMNGKAQGFQSEVTVTLTVDAGVITAIKVDSSNETPGVGTRCGEDEAFLAQFVGKKATPDLGEGIEALSGASVTSNAVIEAANTAIGVGVAEVEIPAAEEAPVGESMTGKAQGFQSEVTVTLTVDAGVITAIEVDSSNETPGVGTRCGEDEAFLAQFVGKKATPDLGEGIEVLTGASVTSKAIIDAVNSLLAAEEPAPAGESMTGKAQGFQSEVTVTLTVDEGVITAIEVDSSNETPGVGTRCGEDEAFLAQFVGKKATPDLGEGIEVLSGASVTSNAVIEAANAAIGVVVDEVELPAVEEAPAGKSMTGKAQGFQSEVTVTLTVDAGVITAIEVDSSNETPGVGTRCGEDEAFLAQFVGKKATPDLGEGIEVLSGASVTSNAVINAVNSLFVAE